jgi:hypothetical protein
MNRRAGKWTRRAVWAALAATFSVGCNPLNIAAFIFAKDEKVPARSPLTFDKDGPKKDKEEVVVALLPQVARDQGPQFASTPNELADKVAKILPELAKENKDKRKIKVLSQTQVNKFKMSNPGWKSMSAGEIGAKLGADFVLEIYLENMRLYQPGTERNVYEARAEVRVSVYEAGAEGGAMKDKYDLAVAYPRNGVRPADAMPESAFKNQFVESMAIEIARQHVEHKASNSIADGR